MWFFFTGCHVKQINDWQQSVSKPIMVLVVHRPNHFHHHEPILCFHRISGVEIWFDRAIDWFVLARIQTNVALSNILPWKKNWLYLFDQRRLMRTYNYSKLLPIRQWNDTVGTEFFFDAIFNFIQIISARNRLTLWTCRGTNLDFCYLNNLVKYQKCNRSVVSLLDLLLDVDGNIPQMLRVISSMPHLQFAPDDATATNRM